MLQQKNILAQDITSYICVKWSDHLMNGIKSVISSHKNHKLSGLQQDHDCPIIQL